MARVIPEPLRDSELGEKLISIINSNPQDLDLGEILVCFRQSIDKMEELIKDKQNAARSTDKTKG